MTEKPPLRDNTQIVQVRAPLRYGVVANISRVYDENVETNLPEHLQRLLDRLDRANE